MRKPRVFKAKTPKTRSGLCGAAGAGRVGDSLDAMVEEYKERHLPTLREEQQFYETRPGLKDALADAVLAKQRNGKRHSHQRRIPFAVLSQVRDQLDLKTVKKASSFECLLEHLRSTVGNIHGVGPLYLYDTARRIGARLGYEPTHVHLQCGALVGARALLGRVSGAVERDRFKPPLSKLRPIEIEDFLCIFKDRLVRLGSTIQSP